MTTTQKASLEATPEHDNAAGELPALPEPAETLEFGIARGFRIDGDCYTAEQMHAYAREALAASRRERSGQKPVGRIVQGHPKNIVWWTAAAVPDIPQPSVARPSQQAASGWVLVPVRPTNEMLDAGMKRRCEVEDPGGYCSVYDIYKYMITAAPANRGSDKERRSEPVDKSQPATVPDNSQPTAARDAQRGVPSLNFRGESPAEVRSVLVNSLVASKCWMNGYAEAYVDEAVVMLATPPADISQSKVAHPLLSQPNESVGNGSDLNELSGNSGQLPASEVSQ